MEITKSLVERYEKLRKSGKYNMLMDAAVVMSKMKLNPRHKADCNVYEEIIKNYSELMKKFEIK